MFGPYQHEADRPDKRLAMTVRKKSSSHGRTLRPEGFWHCLITHIDRCLMMVFAFAPSLATETTRVNPSVSDKV